MNKLLLITSILLTSCIASNSVDNPDLKTKQVIVDAGQPSQDGSKPEVDNPDLKQKDHSEENDSQTCTQVCLEDIVVQDCE